MRYHVVRSLAVAMVAMVLAACGDNLDPPPVDADLTDAGPEDASGDCDGASCAEPTCVDGIENGDETDLDCGGSCAPGRRCGDGLGCDVAGDCQSGVCTSGACAAPACGDGVRQGNEACDDGNHTNGDGCDDGTGGNCRPSGCGNGVRSGKEECDDGNSTQGDGCDNNCTTTGCGNGVITTGEGCDDDGTTAGDGCSATCQVEPGYTCSMVPSVCAGMCGDGVRVGNEMCDDPAPAENGDGCSITCTQEPGYTCTGSPSVCTTACGDGVRAGGEGCDDAPPAESGDGCNASCFVEPGWVCVGTPSLCFPICGDGRVVPTEGCDDPAPAENGDGCSSTCTVETGYMCSGSPSTCGPVCGDGLRLPGEACDDAPPAENGDGCSATCGVELGWTCSGTMPSTCATTCGDGIRAGAEECDDAAPAEDGDGCSATCTVESGYLCMGFMPSTCAPVCGDGLVRPGEGCDDAPPAEDGDGCNAMCQVEVGYVCAGEPSTCQITCGDGDLDAGETCDDGRNDDGDGCSAACQVELGFDCGATTPSVCTSTCGDGVKASNEACDDAAPAEDGDGCSATCTVENGYTCAGATPTVCTPLCGDDLLVPGEPCDDPSPAEDGDGCSATCTIENGWYCSGTPLSTCVTSCGDGVPAGTEQCDDANTVLLDGCALGCRREPTEIEPNEDGTPQTGGSGTSGNDFDSSGGVAVTNANNNAALIPIDVSQGAINILGSIPNAGDEDVFQIRNGSTSQPYSVRVDIWNRAPGFGLGVPCVSTGNFDTGLTIRTATGSVVTSSDDRNGTSDQCSAVTFTVLQGQTFYIHLVEYGDNAPLPAYGIQIVPTPLTCPNGVPDTGEECDDGNANDTTDACRNNCTVRDGCGDGNIDPGEQCDDDNVLSGDGCSSTCQVDITCSAGDVPVIVASTPAAAIPDDNTFASYGASVATSGSVQRAVVHLGSITHANTGHLDLQLQAPNDVIRNLSDDNGSSANYRQTFFDDTATSAITSGSVPYTGRFRPEASLSTTPRVDMRGLRADGTWNLQIRDDTSGTAGTLDAWTLALCVRPGASCGDGATNAATEECDDANTNNGDTCSNTCQRNDGCGDGNLDAGEQCDDDNVTGGDGCTETCQFEISCNPGDVPVILTSAPNAAIPDTNTFTSYGQTVTTTGAVQRAVVHIGSITHAANAHLDIQLQAPNDVVRNLSDDNTGANYTQTFFDDGAATAITAGTAPYLGTFRPEASLSTTPGTDLRGLRADGTWNLQIRDDTTNTFGTLVEWTLLVCVTPGPACGDGSVNAAAEECDDGNTVNTDACSNTCVLNDGCGDGNLDAGEECDDNNLTSGDGCSATCVFDIACGAGETPVILRNTTAVTIADNVDEGALSTITVPTAGVVRRVIAGVNVNHDFTGDVELWLTSPHGAQRALFRNQGGGGDDFVQTFFNDGAALTTATSAPPYSHQLRPEQTISDAAGFVNQSAAGTWILRSLDDAGGIAGSLDNWSLHLCVDTSVSSVCGNGVTEASESCDDGNAVGGDGCSATCQLELACASGQTPVIARSASASALIRDNVAAGSSSSLAIAATGTVRKAVVVATSISHAKDADIDLTLISPAATSIDLTSDQAGLNYLSTQLDDAAAAVITTGTAPYRGRFRPESPLAGVNGQGATGMWVLRAVDDAADDGGVLGEWVLGLCVE